MFYFRIIFLYGNMLRTLQRTQSELLTTLELEDRDTNITSHQLLYDLMACDGCVDNYVTAFVQREDMSIEVCKLKDLPSRIMCVGVL